MNMKRIKIKKGIVFPLVFTKEELGYNNSSQLNFLLEQKLLFAKLSLIEKLEELGFLITK